MEELPGDTKSAACLPAISLVPYVWQLPWVNCNFSNEESPIFIEMGAILTSSGRDSN